MAGVTPEPRMLSPLQPHATPMRHLTHYDLPTCAQSHFSATMKMQDLEGTHLSMNTPQPAPETSLAPNASVPVTAPTLETWKNKALGPLPIVIGVTGHRDLRPADVPAIEAKVRAVFHDLRTRYPATPFVVLSPLAEGADRLVARIGLECGADLVVPLPMEQALYEDDFPDATLLAEFHSLLQRADDVFVLPWGADVNESEARAAGEARSKQYAHVGAYIVRHSQILIALWNGVKAEETGGTSQIVRFRLRGVPEPYAPPRGPLDPVEGGPLFTVAVTPRAGTTLLEGEPLATFWRYPKRFDPSGHHHGHHGGHHDGAHPNGAHSNGAHPNGHHENYQAAPAWTAPRTGALTPDEIEKEAAFEAQEAEFYHRIYERMDIFNRDVVDFGSSLDESREKSKSYVMPAEQVAKLPSDFGAALDFYGIADALALHFGELTNQTVNKIFAWMFIAAIFFHGFSFLQDDLATLLAGAAPAAPHGALHARTPGHDARAKTAGLGKTVQAKAASASTSAHEAPQEAPQHEAPQKGHNEGEAQHSEAGHATAPAKGLSSGELHSGDEQGGEAGEAGAAEHPGGEESELGTWPLIKTETPWLLLGFLMVSAYVRFYLHRRTMRGDYQNKYQDYRTLAEGLRVQFFWRLAGLQDSTADYYLAKQRGELEWIRNAIRAWNIPTYAASHEVRQQKPEEQTVLLTLVLNHWVKDQGKYFAKNAPREETKHETDEKKAQNMAVISIILVLGMAIFFTGALFDPTLHDWKEWLHHHQWLHSVIDVAIGLLLVRAALLHTYNQQRATAENAKRYGRMSVVFADATERLEVLLGLKTRVQNTEVWGESPFERLDADAEAQARAGHHNREEARAIIKELGKEALTENGEWVLLHRERPLEVPEG